MSSKDSRRAFLTIAGAGALLAACRKEAPAEQERAAPLLPSASSAAEAPNADDKEGDVSPTEDLMREHGVIRRILVVYRLSAAHLRAKPASVSLDALQRAAKLMHTFGEEYHEKQLEEAHLFPAVKKAGGAAAGEVGALLAQHQRGREITDYILAATQKTAGSTAGQLARTLEAFALMYEEHAAREDTIVFPAWKKSLSSKQLDEMGDLFEEIEHKTFGKDGFGDAVAQIGAIEQGMGLDNAALTAPPPL